MQRPEELTQDRLTIGQVVDQLSAEFPDITHSSLRFLEREGLIDPDRTAGGHRLFPPEQVNRVRTIKLWQRQRLSLDEIRERLDSADTLPHVEAIAHDLFQALRAGDREGAQRLITQAADLGLPLATIFDGIFVPVLRQTGELWASGGITVGQEKEISAAIRDLIVLLSTRQRVSDERLDRPIIAACVDGELHELGLRMITALLRERGFRVLYLGPSVAPDIIAERVRVRKPAAVILAAQQAGVQPALVAMLRAIRAAGDADDAPLVYIGGAGSAGVADQAAELDAAVIASASLEHATNQIATDIARRFGAQFVN